MSNNNPIENTESLPKIDYTYKSHFTKNVSRLLALPIVAELERRNQSKLAFIEELRENGLNYNYTGFVSAMKGNNPYVFNLTYFSRLYEYLELPFPTIDYLNSFK